MKSQISPTTKEPNVTASPRERWFVAVLVFESSLREAWSDPSVDIQFRLVRAVDAENAFERALALGNGGEISYENPYGEICLWTFKGLQDLREVIDDELGHGVEVYGFIENGFAEDHIIPKEQLTAFFLGRQRDETGDEGNSHGNDIEP
jgi:hypothetical protein